MARSSLKKRRRGRTGQGRPQVWTMTTPTLSLCDMMVGMDLRKMRDGSE